MLKIFSCRRSSLALIAIVLLSGLCYTKGIDVSMAISAIVLAVAGSNSYQASKKP